MNYSSRIWLYGPLAILFGMGAFAAAYWYAVTGALENKLDALNGHEAAPGIVISFASKNVSGFPFNIDVVFGGFAVSGQGAHGPFRWTSEKFALHGLTYGPAQDIYEAAGDQTLSWTDGRGQTHLLKFLPATLHASSVANAGGLTRFDLELVGAGGSDSQGRQFTVNGAQLHLRRDPGHDALDLVVRADDVTAGEDIARLFGTHIKSLSIFATFAPGAAFAPLLAGKESWDKAAGQWRQNGGRAEFGPVSIVSSGVNLSAARFADSGNDLSALLDPLY